MHSIFNTKMRLFFGIIYVKKVHNIFYNITSGKTEYQFFHNILTHIFILKCSIISLK